MLSTYTKNVNTKISKTVLLASEISNNIFKNHIHTSHPCNSCLQSIYIRMYVRIPACKTVRNCNFYSNQFQLKNQATVVSSPLSLYVCVCM